MSTRAWGYGFAAVYVGAIVLANWLVAHVGLITVAPGLRAPAGVYAAGLTFPARDAVQRLLGRWWGIAAIVVAAVLSWAISPVLAVASGTTFLVSETADYLIYTPLQRRWLVPAVVASGVISAVIDSLLFLYLAHIPYHVALAGQVTAKLEVMVLAGGPLALGLRKLTPASS